MRADDILNNTDPNELRNIIRRLLSKQNAGQRATSTLVINQIPESYPPQTGDVVHVAGHDPQRVVITDAGGNITTDDDLKYIPDNYSQIATGSVAGTSATGVEITGLTIGEWYAIEATGGPFHMHTSLPPFNGDYYNFELSLDGVTFSGEIGYNNTVGELRLTLPSFATFAEAIDSLRGRVYFQASTTSVWFRTVDGTWADNSGSLGYNLLHSSAGEKRITLFDVEYTREKLAGAIHTGTAMTAPADTDEFGAWSANLLKKVTWSNIKATLKTYFDAIYLTASNLLTAILAVDGAGSGLDADKLDGVEGSGYLTDAPSDGSTYGRKDAAWATILASGEATVDKKTIYAEQVLHDETLASNGSFDVSSLDQTYDHLILRGRIRSNSAVTIDGMYIILNNDTTVTNYHANQQNVVGATVGGAASDIPSIAAITGANAGADDFCEFTITIQNYTGNKRKQITCVWSLRHSSTGANGVYSVNWESTAAINRIAIRTDNNPTDLLVTGSRLQIIGVKTIVVVTGINAGDTIGNMTYRDAWNSGTAYVINDVVTDGGATYICIADNTNQEPPDITYWDLLGGGGAESDPVFLASEAASFVTGDKTKLDGIETGAEVNNISDANATDLTDGGSTTLHSHAAGSGDMTKVVYDSDDDGIVNQADLADGLAETSGPTDLTMGAVGDGEFLFRSGTSVEGADLTYSEDVNEVITVEAGVETGGQGKDLIVKAGSGTAGGLMSLRGGDGDANDAGSFDLRGGNSTSGDGGNVGLYPGVGGGGNGVVFIAKPGGGAVVSLDTAAVSADRVQSFQNKSGIFALTNDPNTATADTPLDADQFSFWDAVDAIIKGVTWANVKATLKTYFDGLYILKSLFDANTILAATSDDTPAALTVGEATVVGRQTGGNIDDIAQVSAGEKTAGTETALRAFSPDDVKDMIDTHAPGGSGVVIQVVGNQTGAVATGTTAIPLDDTIPQNTEGTEFLTQAITPTNAAHELHIDVDIFLTGSSAQWLTVALFQDTTAGALATTSFYNQIATAGAPIHLKFKMTAGTTSATTFKVRAGTPNGAITVTRNGQSGGRFFGGTLYSSIKISEIVP